MTQPNSSQKDFAIERYIEFKGWSGFGQFTAKESRYFRSLLFEMPNRRTDKELNILELGFGNGSFMSFCKHHGYSIIGVEINQDLLDIAKANGHCVCHVSNIETLEYNTFDFIVALDVLEHMQPNDILDILSRFHCLLRHNGQFIARFPNGDSPFSMHDQNADPTHVTYIGSTLITSLAKLADFELITITDEPILIGKNYVQNILKISKRAFLSLLNDIMKAIVFRGTEVRFFSPTLVVRLCKKSPEPLPKFS